jgi:hypothetical protein
MPVFSQASVLSRGGPEVFLHSDYRGPVRATIGSFPYGGMGFLVEGEMIFAVTDLTLWRTNFRVWPRKRIGKSANSLN